MSLEHLWMAASLAVVLAPIGAIWLVTDPVPGRPVRRQWGIW